MLQKIFVQPFPKFFVFSKVTTKYQEHILKNRNLSLYIRVFLSKLNLDGSLDTE